MENDVDTIEEDINEAQAEDFFNEPEPSQVDELIDSLDNELQPIDQPDMEDLPDPGIEDKPDAKDECEPSLEDVRENISDKLAEVGSADSVPLEVVQEFGAGQWDKTYEEQGETKFNFQTGEMMSQDGSVSLTKQIQENATGQQTALHEQVIKGWMESSGGAQLIAFNETTENGIVVHVTKTWVKQDGQVASETWSKAIPKKIQPEQPGLADPESLFDDYDDGSLQNQGVITGEGSVSFAAEAEAKIQEAATEEVGVNEVAGAEISGIELQNMGDGDLGSSERVQSNIQAEVPIALNENPLTAENSPALEQPTDFAPSLEIDDFDGEVQRVEISQPDKNTADTAVIAREPEFIEQLSGSQIPEIPVVRKEQTEPIVSAQAEIVAIDTSLESISLVEDLPEGDNDDFELDAVKAEAQKAQFKNKTVIEPAEVWEKTGGIELIDINDNGPDLEKDIMPATMVTEILEHGRQEQQQPHEPIEITGITLLDDSEIQVTELTTEALELKPGIAKAGETLRPVVSLETILPGKDILKPEVLEQDLSGMEIEEILQVPKAVENTAPVINFVKEGLTEIRLNQEPVFAEQESKTPESIAVKPAVAKEQVKAAPTFRIEQSFNIAGLKADAQKFNQRVFQTTSGRQNSKPIIVKFSQKNFSPFRPAELINKILTFKPAIVAGDDELANNTVETYIPEFELAA